ncbi:MAG: 6,7-dimethyl-8-ribityllumazine synthase [Verrucomicrobiae bacterium]|nr:6,7-dimethyl-8-ribityllumazine synthase [Verrucomicrobiae bacterium]NNJ86636.1 6,7-dimethyl-8-ribityllumazine synthase [Akkermansiaceae bacterium]
MSKVLPPKPRSLNHKTNITIVASQYNAEFTDALVENAHKELTELTSAAQIDLVRVPGAFEIPAAVEAVMRHESPACVIALGLIIRGQTAHGDLVADSVTHALQRIAVDHATPVVHEVILCADEKQAYARCIGNKLNRGKEAARAAVSIVETFHQLKRTTSRVFPSNV